MLVPPNPLALGEYVVLGFLAKIPRSPHRLSFSNGMYAYFGRAWR